MDALRNFWTKSWSLIMIVVLLIGYYIFFTFAHNPNNSLSMIFNNIYLSGISAFFIFNLFQLPTVKKSIDGYFTNAFLNPLFIKGIQTDTLEEFMVQSLQVKGCDESLAREVVDLVQENNEVWVNSYNEVITLSYEEEKYKISVRRNLTLVTNDKNFEQTLGEFLEGYLRPDTVYFRNVEDFRKISKIEVKVNGKLTSPITVSNIDYPDDEHTKVDTLDWAKIKRDNDLSMVIKGDDSVSIEWEDYRVFDRVDLFKTLRIPFWTKGVDIRVINKLPDFNAILRFYGSGVTEDTCKVDNDPLRICTSKWIHPGSGYVIILFQQTNK